MKQFKNTSKKTIRAGQMVVHHKGGVKAAEMASFLDNNRMEFAELMDRMDAVLAKADPKTKRMMLKTLMP